MLATIALGLPEPVAMVDGQVAFVVPEIIKFVTCAAGLAAFVGIVKSFRS